MRKMEGGPPNGVFTSGINNHLYRDNRTGEARPKKRKIYK